MMLVDPARIPLWALLLVPFVLLRGVATAEDSGSEAPGNWRIGRQLDRELNRTVNFVLNRTTPRIALRRLREVHQVAVLLDRRIDADQRIDVQLVQLRLEDGLRLLAHQLGAEMARVGGTVFIGPAASTDRIRTLIELRVVELQSTGAEVTAERRWDLLQCTTQQWELLSNPQRLLESFAGGFDLRVTPSDPLPHDLWGDGVMADVNAVEALSLILGQFDLTFEWEPKATGIVVVDAPESVTVIRKHQPGRLGVEDALQRVRAEWPDLEANASGRQLLIRASAGQHDAIAAFLHPGRDLEPGADPPPAPLERRRFTLTATRAEVLAILRTLQTQGIEVVYDQNRLREAKVDLRQKVSLKLEEATAEELFSQICEPLGLKFQIDENRVTLTAP